MAPAKKSKSVKRGFVAGNRDFSLGKYDKSKQKAQIGIFFGQEVEKVTSFALSAAHPSENTAANSPFVKGLSQNVSPPWREDHKDRHYMFELGENLTSRYKIQNKMGEGTFGQVLECWDFEQKEMVAINIVRGVKKYREAAMIEIDMLQQLCRHDKGGNRCVQIPNWFDYHNHICIEIPNFTSQFTSSNSLESRPLQGLRVGIIRETLEDGVDATVVSSIRAAASHFEDLGCYATEVSLPSFSLGLPAYYVSLPSNLSTYHCDTNYHLKKRASSLAWSPINRSIIYGIISCGI